MHRSAPPTDRAHWAAIGSIVLATTLMAACTTPRTDRVSTAASTPLADLNLVQTAIPEALKRAQAAPYARPADPACPTLRAELKELDLALGPDLDAPGAADDDDLLGDAAAGALQRTAEGVVPFRGWIRKLSGAERRAKQVLAAVNAGRARRSFLKGLAAGSGCE